MSKLKNEMTVKELELFLKQQRLSDHMLADLLGVTKPAIDHWLTGRRSIPKTTVKLLRFFNNYPDAMRVFG